MRTGTERRQAGSRVGRISITAIERPFGRLAGELDRLDDGAGHRREDVLASMRTCVRVEYAEWSRTWRLKRWVPRYKCVSRARVFCRFVASWGESWGGTRNRGRCAVRFRNLGDELGHRPDVAEPELGPRARLARVQGQHLRRAVPRAVGNPLLGFASCKRERHERCAEVVNRMGCRALLRSKSSGRAMPARQGRRCRRRARRDHEASGPRRASRSRARGHSSAAAPFLPPCEGLRDVGPKRPRARVVRFVASSFTRPCSRSTSDHRRLASSLLACLRGSRFRRPCGARRGWSCTREARHLPRGTGTLCLERARGHFGHPLRRNRVRFEVAPRIDRERKHLAHRLGDALACARCELGGELGHHELDLRELHRVERHRAMSGFTYSRSTSLSRVASFARTWSGCFAWSVPSVQLFANSSNVGTVAGSMGTTSPSVQSASRR